MAGGSSSGNASSFCAESIEGADVFFSGDERESGQDSGKVENDGKLTVGLVERLYPGFRVRNPMRKWKGQGMPELSELSAG